MAARLPGADQMRPYSGLDAKREITSGIGQLGEGIGGAIKAGRKIDPAKLRELHAAFLRGDDPRAVAQSHRPPDPGAQAGTPSDPTPFGNPQAAPYLKPLPNFTAQDLEDYKAAAPTFLNDDKATAANTRAADALKGKEDLLTQKQKVDADLQAERERGLNSRQQNDQMFKDVQRMQELDDKIQLEGNFEQKKALALEKAKLYARMMAVRANGPALDPETARKIAEDVQGGAPVPPGMGRTATTQVITNAYSGGSGVGAKREEFKADAGSLKKMQAMRDSVGSFEKTAGKNLDLFMESIKKIPDTDVPALNKLVRSFATNILGSTELAESNTTRQVAANEIARVVSTMGAGILSDSARKEAMELLSGDATKAQLRAAARRLRQDMANRMASLDDSIDDIKSRLGPAKKGSAGKTAKGRVHVRNSKTGEELDIDAADLAAAEKDGFKAVK